MAVSVFRSREGESGQSHGQSTNLAPRYSAWVATEVESTALRSWNLRETEEKRTFEQKAPKEAKFRGSVTLGKTDPLSGGRFPVGAYQGTGQTVLRPVCKTTSSHG